MGHLGCQSFRRGRRFCARGRRCPFRPPPHTTLPLHQTSASRLSIPQMPGGPAMEEGLSPVALAAHRGDEAQLERLLRADPKALNAADHTPFQHTLLHLAAGAVREKGELNASHLACVKLLLSRGADPRSPAASAWTPLHYAALRGSLPVVQALVQAAGDGPLPANAGARTPYDLGAVVSNVDVCI